METSKGVGHVHFREPRDAVHFSRPPDTATRWRCFQFSLKKPCFLRPRCPAAHQGRPWLPGTVPRPKAELPSEPPFQQTLLLPLWSSHFMSAFSPGSQLSAVTSAIGAPESRVRSAESHCQPLTSQRWVAISALSVQLALSTAGGTRGVEVCMVQWETPMSCCWNKRRWCAAGAGGDVKVLLLRGAEERAASAGSWIRGQGSQAASFSGEGGTEKVIGNGVQALSL